MSRLLIVAHEPIGQRMAGPAIRCLELARTASLAGVDVTLTVPEPPTLDVIGVTVVAYRPDRPADLQALADQADSILLSGYLLRRYPELATSDRPIVVDLYDPFPLENLDLRRRAGASADERELETARDFRALNRLAEVGDFFICGNDRQRDFWLGLLAANGRVGPATADIDPTLESLIAVVPMGIPDEPPAPVWVDGGLDVRGEFVLVWPGGVWEWLDPETALSALAIVRETHPEVRLAFPGVRHPQPERVATMASADGLRTRAAELGLGDGAVTFGDWAPYAERERYLTGVGAALSLHRAGLESRYAIRSRLLDCVWARVPVVATVGDPLGEELAARGLATLVPPSDAKAVAGAILEWLADRADRSRLGPAFDEVAARYRWSVVSRPIVEFALKPHFAPDRRRLMAGELVGTAADRFAASSADPLAPRAVLPALDADPGVDRAELMAALAETRRDLSATRADLDAARYLLERVSRGRVMRILNAVGRLANRGRRT